MSAQFPTYGNTLLKPYDYSHMAFYFHQLIDVLGSPVTYNVRSDGIPDEYGHNTISFTPQGVIALISGITAEEYRFVEPGLLPAHYAKMWEYTVQPRMGDRVNWMGWEWEVRGIFPQVIGSQVVFWDTVVRRVLV